MLLTGASGGLGRHIAAEILARGHVLRAFDLATPAATRWARGLSGETELVWGDLRDDASVRRAVEGVDAIIHNAFVIYPASERDPAAAEAVNVGGTKRIVEAAKALAPEAPFVFASSYHVHPYREDRGRPLRIDDEIAASDHYAAHKIAAEAIVRDSGLPATILRLSSILLDRKMTPENLRLIFEIPMDTRFEMVHPRDAATAFVNATETPAVRGRTLFVGGGPSCQRTYRRFYEEIFGAVGLGPFPDEAYSEKPFIGDWLDTAESEALLKFQRRTIANWVETQRVRGPTRWATRLLRPLIQRWMLRYSQRWQSRHAALPGR